MRLPPIPKRVRSCRAAAARGSFVTRSRASKSGSYRIVSYFGGENTPVFLITVFGKGEKSNLSDAEKNAVAKLTKRLRDEY
jgi:hypothetical protein